MRVRVSKDAATELEEAALWYEQEVAGLGGQLIDAFEDAVTLLKEPNPPLVPVSYESAIDRASQLILHRFPYSLITIEKEAELVVIALAHHRRVPGYWRNRFDP